MSLRPASVRSAASVRLAASGLGLSLAAVLAGCADADAPVTAASTPLASPSPQAAPPAQTRPSTPAEPAPQTVPAPQASQQQDSKPAKRRARGAVITTGASEYGRMLFDDDGQAIYIWERETSTKPRCYDDCADAWPPVLTEGAPVAAGRAAGSALGTTRRSDGSTQVTYNGHPLYYYADERPGEVRCHNVATHGGLWWVLQPNGDPAP